MYCNIIINLYRDLYDSIIPVAYQSSNGMVSDNFIQVSEKAFSIGSSSRNYSSFFYIPLQLHDFSKDQNWKPTRSSSDVDTTKRSRIFIAKNT